MMPCFLLLILTLAVFHSQAHFINDSIACLPLLVKDNGECACPDGKGTAFGGLVHCSANCNNENEGCSVAGEIVYPACVSYDKPCYSWLLLYCHHYIIGSISAECGLLKS